MAAVPGGPVVSFSYLAAASLWTVERFPAANHAATIDGIEESIAADGPMVAAVLAALGQPSLLLANGIGDDTSGRHVRAWLERHQVATTATTRTGIPTPQITVIGDGQHTRTIFPFLPGVADELGQIDLAPLDTASFAYVDCYGGIDRAAIRAIQSARSAGLPLLANLGGDNPSAGILDVLDGYPDLTVQTSIAEESLETAARLAVNLQSDIRPEWAVITAGAAGVAAASTRDVLRVSAFHANVRHTHCAGAAFSGGLLYGLVHGWEMRDCLDFASASGALRCERSHDERMPTIDQLRVVVQSRKRATASAGISGDTNAYYLSSYPIRG
jgi:sugar/nucleoside kinase (ribokinase family)